MSFDGRTCNIDVDWTITIDNAGHAHHTVLISVKNIAVGMTSLTRSIRLGLSATGGHRAKSMEIRDRNDANIQRSMPEDWCYNSNQNCFEITFDSIPSEFHSCRELEIAVRFTETGSVHKLGSIRLYDIAGDVGGWTLTNAKLKIVAPAVKWYEAPLLWIMRKTGCSPSVGEHHIASIGDVNMEADRNQLTYEGRTILPMGTAAYLAISGRQKIWTAIQGVVFTLAIAIGVEYLVSFVG